jgi:Universal stress protein family
VDLQCVIDEDHAGLVVVGSTKRGAIGQIAPGTSAQRVINRCACPVVVVPHGTTRRSGSPRPAAGWRALDD